jgi:hypothetical protein
MRYLLVAIAVIVAGAWGRPDYEYMPGVYHATGGGAWTPANLSLLVAWYDPSDLATMWQDSAKTTPVTASGQPVGYMSDKSGNAYHLMQATAANRPTLAQDVGGRLYLTLTAATPMYMVNAAPTGTINQGKSLFFVGVAGQAISNGTGGVILAMSNPTVEFGHSVEGLRVGWTALGRRLSTDPYNAIAVGTNDYTLQSVIGVYDYANATAAVYKNNTSVASGAFETPGLSETAGATSLALGEIAGYGAAFDGIMYQMVLGNALTTADRASLDAFLRTKAGI